MNKTVILFLILSFSYSYGQNSFEGKLKFSTKISIYNGAPLEYGELPSIYGDSLIILYSSNGNFKRIHLNSAAYGKESQTFDAKKGMIYFTSKNGEKDSLDTSKNSLKLVEKRKINNENILGKNCDCWEYDCTDIDGEYVFLAYCFSLDSPIISPNIYLKHQDFFLFDFYKFSKRPYLKFSLETKNFGLTYSATSISEEKIADDNFKNK